MSTLSVVSVRSTSRGSSPGPKSSLTSPSSTSMYLLYTSLPSFDLTFLSFLHAVPTAELIPIGPDNAIQSDEIEMGMTYDELSVFGRLRKVEKCGPFSMFGKLVQEWGSFLSPKEIAEKVKHFFFMYAINRHKMYVLFT